MPLHTDVTADVSAPDPAPEQVAIWIAMNRARLAVMRNVDKTLRAKGLPPLTWYDVLWSVEQRGGAARPGDIIDDLLFEPSALSHMTKRMAAAGLLDIRVAEGDKRGRVLHLTEKGLHARAAIWTIYGSALQSQLSPLGQLPNPDAVASALASIAKAAPQ